MANGSENVAYPVNQSDQERMRPSWNQKSLIENLKLSMFRLPELEKAAQYHAITLKYATQCSGECMKHGGRGEAYN